MKRAPKAAAIQPNQTEQTPPEQTQVPDSIIEDRRMWIRLFLVLMFGVCIIAADISLILFHGRTYSEKENRVLQQMPAVTGDALLSGKFMTRAEEFVSDQFMLRDDWMTYRLYSDRILGKRDVNGVYLGNNGYLLEQEKETDEENFLRNLEAIRQFAASQEARVVMTVVPNAACVCDQLLPAWAEPSRQEETILRIREAVEGSLAYVDVTEALSKHKEEYIYYKSDHHWTSLGAKYGFEALAPALQIWSMVDAYDAYCVTDSFSGTLSNATGAQDVKDTVYLLVPQSDIRYVAEYVGENIKTPSIYSSQALETSGQYDVFLNGNHPLIRIQTTADTGRNLLLIKDSYANAMVQFLLPYFSNVYIVDPRYYSDNLYRLIADGEMTDILLLYNVNTFVEDNSLAGVLEQ